jgi:DNA mismatch repair ATPase MutL
MGMSPSVFEETGPNVDVETEQKMQKGVKDTIVNFFGGGTTAGSSSSNRNNSKSVDSNPNSDRRTPSGEGKPPTSNSAKPASSKSDKPPLPAYMKFSPPPPQKRPGSNNNNHNKNNGGMTSTAGKHSRSSSSSSNPPHPPSLNPNLEISIPPPPTGVDLLAHPESNERTDSSMTTRARKYSLGKGDSPMAKDPNAEARVHRSPPANREKQIVVDSGYWTCTTCTLINPKENDMCEACGVWRSS